MSIFAKRLEKRRRRSYVHWYSDVQGAVHPQCNVLACCAEFLDALTRRRGGSGEILG